MDDKRTALAIFLSILVIIIYTELVMKPREAQMPRQGTTQTAPTPAESLAGYTGGAPGASGPAAPATPAALSNPSNPAAAQAPARDAYLQSPVTTVSSQDQEIKISQLGGRIVSLKLKKFRATLNEAETVEMVNSLSKAFPLGVYAGGLSDANVTYQLTGVSAGATREGETYLIPANGTLSLNFTGRLPNGIGIKKSLLFSDQKYFFEAAVELDAPSPDGSSLWLEWDSVLAEHHKKESWNPSTFILLSSENSITRMPSESVSTIPVESSDKWVAFGNNYFMTALIPTQPGPNAVIWKDGDSYLFRALGGKKDGKFVIYSGPKSLEYLGGNSFELSRSIDLGWFSFIGQPILMGIEVLFSLLGNYGLAIILLTLLVKTLLLPLTKTSFKSMKAMQDLQPELKVMRERYKDKPNELNQATMALFKDRGVNPMGGCFPILIQLPIFLGMYNALRTSFSLRHAPFALWIKDLAAPENLVLFGIPVPVMILIMGVSMFLQQLTTPSSAPPEQQRMMMMMPVFFTVMFIIWPFPSGLVLYWLVNNLISIIQQMALRSERNITPLQATVLGGVVIFGTGFVLTLL